MEMTFMSLALNIIIMGLLGAVIYYARKLSESIAVFRNSRKEMNQLIMDLSLNVDKAEAAIKAMRRETDTSADDLHFMITKARALSEELQFIQESGDRLATRLEKASQGAGRKSPTESEKLKPSKKHEKKSPPKPMFNIIDRDEDTIGDAENIPEFLTNETDIPDNLQSQAEKDLADALKRQKKTNKG